MKLQKFESLEKHLFQAHPDHLSNIYLISCSLEGERDFLLIHIAKIIEKKSNAVLLQSATLRRAIDFVRSTSLFGERLLATAEIKKEEVALFSEYMKLPMRGTHLVLGVENGKLAEELYQINVREMILLDLSQESSFLRKRRLSDWITRRFESEKKNISSHVVEMLLQRSELDLRMIEQEIEKLLCFVGERKEICEKDLQAISIESSMQMNGFQLAEQLIEGKYPIYQLEDFTELSLLLGAIRYLFEEGLRFSSQIELGKEPFNKRAALLKKRNSLFFQQGLCFLFQLELQAKRKSAIPQLLFDRFCAQVLLK